MGEGKANGDTRPKDADEGEIASGRQPQKWSLPPPKGTKPNEPLRQRPFGKGVGDEGALVVKGKGRQMACHPPKVFVRFFPFALSPKAFRQQSVCDGVIGMRLMDFHQPLHCPIQAMGQRHPEVGEGSLRLPSVRKFAKEGSQDWSCFSASSQKAKPMHLQREVGGEGGSEAEGFVKRLHRLGNSPRPQVDEAEGEVSERVFGGDGEEAMCQFFCLPHIPHAGDGDKQAPHQCVIPSRAGEAAQPLRLPFVTCLSHLFGEAFPFTCQFAHHRFRHRFPFTLRCGSVQPKLFLRRPHLCRALPKVFATE